MKSFLFFLFWLVLASTAIAKKNCSEENLVQLVRLTGALLGEVGAVDIKITKLLHSSTNTEMTAKQIRKQHVEIAKNKQRAIQSSLEKIGILMKNNPECNIDGLFAVKK